MPPCFKWTGIAQCSAGAAVIRAIRPSRSDPFPPVFVMEAAENHASHNLAVLGKGMFVVILQRWEYRGTFQLHRQLRCHARLSPSWILFCHLHDELADVLRNSWPTGLRLPFPKQLETLAMPANQGLWFGDDQGPFPLAEARPDDERETGGVVQSPWLDLPLLIEGQLLSQE